MPRSTGGFRSRAAERRCDYGSAFRAIVSTRARTRIAPWIYAINSKDMLIAARSHARFGKSSVKYRANAGADQENSAQPACVHG